MSRARIFASGMRIGRDHIASTIYTIVFAYAGTALAAPLLMRSTTGRCSTGSATIITEEIMRMLDSAIGLVLAVPVATAIAAATVASAADPADSSATS